MSWLDSQPAAAPPPGVTLNFIDPPSQVYLVVVTLSVCLSCTTLLVLPRIYMCAFTSRAFKWEDLMCFLAWLGLIGYAVIYIEACKTGGLIDQWNLTAGEVIRWGQYAVDAEILYFALLFLTKLSILLLYLRIFVPSTNGKSKVYWAIHGVIWFNALFYTAVTFAEIFSCTPREKIWDPESSGHCINIYAILIVSAAINVFSDLMMIIIPLSVIWGLQMAATRKFGTSIIFAFGTFSLVCGMMRTIMLVIGEKDPNQTMALSKVALWAFGEVSAGLLASCMPTMLIFIRHLSSRKYIQALCDSPPRRSRRGHSKTLKTKWRERMLNSFARKTVHDRQAELDGPYLLRTIYSELEEPRSITTPFSNGGNSVEASSGHSTYLPSGADNEIFVSKTVNVESEKRGHQDAVSLLTPAHLGPERL